eukprot:5908567-Amphidinium_carterae.2
MLGRARPLNGATSSLFDVHVLARLATVMRSDSWKSPVLGNMSSPLGKEAGHVLVILECVDACERADLKCQQTQRLLLWLAQTRRLACCCSQVLHANLDHVAFWSVQSPWPLGSKLVGQ